MDSIAILLEEAAFLVVNKPAGLFTQAAPGIPSLETELIKLLKQRGSEVSDLVQREPARAAPSPPNPFVGLPHRLDRGTSGAVLIARNERSLKRFGLQFQTRKIDKRYWGICHGVFPHSSGTWEDHMRKVVDQPVAEIVTPTADGAKNAILHYRVIARTSDQSLVEFQLETGRMHQIRLQAASRGFPILGDNTYGSPLQWGDRDPEGRWQQLALHARRIEFRHPNTARPIAVDAPPPENWNPLLAIFGPTM